MPTTLLAVSSFLFCLPGVWGLEIAPYQLVRQEGAFEIRDYPALQVVETTMEPAQSNESFRRLFQFISGKNSATQKIAMTAPVFMSESEKMMAFVLPSKLATMPAPTEPTVRLRQLAAGRFAVYRFSGSRSEAAEARATKKLCDFLQAEGLASSAAPIFGYYDPPWTLPFLRRNEVMFRLEPLAGSPP